MLDKLTRFFRPTESPGEPAPESREDSAAPRDLVVEGAVAPALRDVFSKERSRTAAGQVITLYDPQRAFTPVLPRLIDSAGGTSGDRIRLVEARSRKPLAFIDRALLSSGGSVLRLLEIDLACADRPSRDVPLTLLEQSDVGVVLLGAEPDTAWLEALVMACLEPTWRCTSLVLAVPRDAPLALGRLARYNWPAGTRTEPLADAATDLPRLLTSLLRRPASAPWPAPDTSSHVDRISKMLASVATHEPLHPLTEARVLDTPPAVLMPEPEEDIETTVPAALIDLDHIPAPKPTAKSVSRGSYPTPDSSLSRPVSPETFLAPLMRVPGAIAAALIDLRDAHLKTHLGATGALTAAQPAVLLGCRPLALAAERLDRLAEWAWIAGGRQHLLQPLAADPLQALLMVLDAERCDLSLARWSCTVARNGIEHNAASVRPAAHTDIALSASSSH